MTKRRGIRYFRRVRSVFRRMLCSFQTYSNNRNSRKIFSFVNFYQENFERGAIGGKLQAFQDISINFFFNR